MKRIVTFDKANKPYGFPQLNASGSIPNGATTGSNTFVSNQIVSGSLSVSGSLIQNGYEVKPYKVYTALLTQSGGSIPGYYTNQAAGPGLTIGVTYSITDGINGNDDFTNVGAPAGEIYPVFVATGTTPNVWDNATRTYFDTGAPVVTAILENTIGDITWTYYGVGLYIGTLTNAFTQNKTYVNSTNSCITFDSAVIGSIVLLSIDVNRINIITTLNPGSHNNDDILGQVVGNIIEIRVYN